MEDVADDPLTEMGYSDGTGVVKVTEWRADSTSLAGRAADLYAGLVRVRSMRRTPPRRLRLLLLANCRRSTSDASGAQNGRLAAQARAAINAEIEYSLEVDDPYAESFHLLFGVLTAKDGVAVCRS